MSNDEEEKETEEFNESPTECSFELRPTPEEAASMAWLRDTLVKIANKDDHVRNQDAINCLNFIERASKYSERAHVLMHLQSSLRDIMLSDLDKDPLTGLMDKLSKLLGASFVPLGNEEAKEVLKSMMGSSTVEEKPDPQDLN